MIAWYVTPIVNPSDKTTTVFSNCTDGDIQLVGGANATVGAVQACMNNAWGSVCNDRFGTNDATVVCRQLGFPATGTEAFRDAGTRFNISTGPVFLDRVDCSGSESRVMDCRQTLPGLAQCTASEIAGVNCIGQSGFKQLHNYVESKVNIKSIPSIFVFLLLRCGPVSDQQWRVCPHMHQ